MTHLHPRMQSLGRVASAAAALLLTLPAHAQGTACSKEILGTGSVRSVINGRTVLLEDGRTVRLAGIEVPPLDTQDLPAERGDFGLAAKTALERLTLNKSVVLKGAGPLVDRHGRVVAQVFAAAEGLERSVQHAMLTSGLARVAARVGDGACAAELLAAERQAREARLGLWADPHYGPRRAEEPATVLAERGRFALVEGRVLSVRESGGTIYVNFGRRWSEDFTVTIAKRNERMFAAAGLEPKRLERQRIRVRGWVEQRGGPWIDATRPEQIELLGRN